MFLIKALTFILLIGYYLFGAVLTAQILYVSPSGDDTNPGTIDKPLATFKGARDKVRTMINSGEDITVYFRGGFYHFNETVSLDHNDSGKGNQSIIFSGYQDEKPVFTSGIPVAGWEQINPDDPGHKYLSDKAKSKVYVAPLLNDLKLVRHLIDHQADWLSLGKINVTDNVTTEKFVHGNSVEGQMWDPPEEKKICTFSRSMEGLSNIDSALMFSIYTADFELQILPVEKIEDMTLITATPGGHRLALPEEEQKHGSNELAFIHNLLEGIDEPGKWACYPNWGKIYLWPIKGTEQIYIPTLNEIIRIEGVSNGTKAWFSTSDEKPVKNIIFDGITFMNCEQPVWLESDIAAQHDWALLDKDNALLRFRGAENCVVRNCTFRKSGGGGIAFDLYAKNNLVENSLFEYLGFEAVRFSGYGIGQKDENINNTFRNNEIHHVNEIHQYGAAIVVWNSGFNTVENNYIHHFASRAVLLSAPRSRAFTKNNQPLFPADRVMREQAWPMARWFEVPDEALAIIKMTDKNIRHEVVKGHRDGVPMDMKGDTISAKYRYLKGNLVQRNVICCGAEALFADGIYYVTACAYGEPNKIIENYVYNTGVGYTEAKVPFRLLYVDAFSGEFIITRNFVYNSKFKFEVIAPYSWWGVVSNKANIFYHVEGDDEEYFGNRLAEGNICIGIGPNDPQKVYLEDYHKMVEILKSDQLPGPKPLPGSNLILNKMKAIIGKLEIEK